jgi:transcriptional regulator NrdR family protein
MAGIHCVNCGSTKTSVANTRRIPDMVKRRRLCEDCGCKFTTYEKVGKVTLPKVSE